MNYKCSYCGFHVESEKLPEGWSKAKLNIPCIVDIDKTACPAHQETIDTELSNALNIKNIE